MVCGFWKGTEEQHSDERPLDTTLRSGIHPNDVNTTFCRQQCGCRQTFAFAFKNSPAHGMNSRNKKFRLIITAISADTTLS